MTLKVGCVCMCKLQPTRVCQLLTCSSPIKATPGRRNAVLCPFWTSLPLRFPAASSFSFSFCHSAFFTLPLTLCISISLYLDHFPPLLYPSFPVCLPGVKSSLILFASVTCLSFFSSVFSPPSTSSLATSHPFVASPTLSVPPN